jgi:hypothetical protein
LTPLPDGEAPAGAVKRITTRLKAKPNEIASGLATELDNARRDQLHRLLGHVDWHEGQKSELEDDLTSALADHFGHQDRLEVIPGVSRHASASVLAEIGPDMAVFGSSERPGKRGSVCTGNNESPRKKRSGRTAPHNKWLRRKPCECTHAAAKTAQPLRVRLQRHQGAPRLQAHSDRHRAQAPQDHIRP